MHRQLILYIIDIAWIALSSYSETRKNTDRNDVMCFGLRMSRDWQFPACFLSKMNSILSRWWFSVLVNFWPLTKAATNARVFFAGKPHLTKTIFVSYWCSFSAACICGQLSGRREGNEHVWQFLQCSTCVLVSTAEFSLSVTQANAQRETVFDSATDLGSTLLWDHEMASETVKEVMATVLPRTVCLFHVQALARFPVVSTWRHRGGSALFLLFAEVILTLQCLGTHYPDVA